MSTDIPPSFSSFPAGSDPRLPQGEWFANGTSTGDASGGSNFQSIVFFASTHPPTGQVFSLEAIGVSTGNGGSANPVRVEAVGWDYGGNSAGTNQRIIGMIETAAYAGGSAITGYSRDSLTPRPVFLGAPVDGAEASVSIRGTNDDGVAQRIVASGKWWIPEARYLGGGPVLEGAVVAPLPVELQQSQYYQLLRAGLIGEFNLEQLNAARISQATRSIPAAAAARIPSSGAAATRGVALGTQRSASAAPQSTYQQQQEAGRALAARAQIVSSIQNRGRIEVTPNITTRDVQRATGESIAISALIASAPKGISVQQYQAFNRASEILADPRFARTEN